MHRKRKRDIAPDLDLLKIAVVRTHRVVNFYKFSCTTDVDANRIMIGCSVISEMILI